MVYISLPKGADAPAVAGLVDDLRVGRGLTRYERDQRYATPGEVLYYVESRGRCHCNVSFGRGWLEVMRTAVTSNATPYVGLLWTSGDELPPTGKRVVPEPQLALEHLEAMEQGVVMIVERGSRRGVFAHQSERSARRHGRRSRRKPL